MKNLKQLFESESRHSCVELAARAGDGDSVWGEVSGNADDAVPLELSDRGKRRLDKASNDCSLLASRRTGLGWAANETTFALLEAV